MDNRIARLQEMVEEGSAYNFPKAMAALALASIAMDLNVIARQHNPQRVD